MPISDYEKDRLRKRERPLPVTAAPKDPAGSNALRDELARKRQTRDGKLARVFADPSQVTKQGVVIVVDAPGVDPVIAQAEREAKEARRLADEARRRAK
jgi:hypothetical protein